MKLKQVLYVLLPLTTGIVGCGKVGDLQPRTGQLLPAKAYGQTEAQSAETLTTTSIQARPSRSDELLRRSERRVEDPFDLPPKSEKVITEDAEAKASAATADAALQPKFD